MPIPPPKDYLKLKRPIPFPRKTQNALPTIEQECQAGCAAKIEALQKKVDDLEKLLKYYI